MASKWQENIDLEAILRSSMGSSGGQLYRGGTDPPQENNLDACSEDSDEISLRQYHERSLEEVPFPPDVDLLNSWEEVGRDCEPDKKAYPSLQEPSVQLDMNGLPATHFCEYCQHVVIKSESLKTVQRVLLAKSRNELDRASEAGCTLFEQLRWYLYGCISNPPSPCSDIYLIFRPDSENDGYLGSIRGEFIDFGANDKGVKGKGEFGPFSLVAPRCDPAERSVRFQPVNLSVCSEESISTATKWIDQCHADHASCNISHGKELPTRLLLITNDTLRLVKTSDIRGDKRYAALSYCWGGIQEQKTITKNLDQRYIDGIDISELPASLRDAVTVAKRLHLSYLWIDSLCIIQDNDADKAHEVARMADIYSGAHMTISAASAACVQDGFLQDRKPSANRKHTVPLRFECPDGRMGWVYFYRRDYFDPKKDDPLNSRGWALQEHVLSPRLLIYGTWQMRWVCRTMQVADGGPDHAYPQAWERLTTKLESPRTYLSVYLEMRSAIEENRLAKGMRALQELHDIIDFWPRLVEEFTRRDLTEPKDRSAAIYGIAKRYGKLTGSIYRAGLWSLNNNKLLLWKRPSTFDGPLRNLESARPTWSWISVDGPVDWELGLAAKKSKLEVLELDTSAESGPSGAISHLPLGVKGRIRDGFYLKIAPKVLFFRNCDDLSEELFDRGGRNPDEPPTDLALTATGTFDYPKKHIGSEGVEVIFLLEVIPSSDDDESNKDDPSGIVLKLDENMNFRRVGYFNFEWINVVWMTLYNSGSEDHDERRNCFKKEVFASCPMEEITIL